MKITWTTALILQYQPQGYCRTTIIQFGPISRSTVYLPLSWSWGSPLRSVLRAPPPWNTSWACSSIWSSRLPFSCWAFWGVTRTCWRPRHRRRCRWRRWRRPGRRRRCVAWVRTGSEGRGRCNRFCDPRGGREGMERWMVTSGLYTNTSKKIICIRYRYNPHKETNKSSVDSQRMLTLQNSIPNRTTLHIEIGNPKTLSRPSSIMETHSHRRPYSYKYHKHDQYHPPPNQLEIN